jgi:hypothetical protein
MIGMVYTPHGVFGNRTQNTNKSFRPHGTFTDAFNQEIAKRKKAQEEALNNIYRRGHKPGQGAGGTTAVRFPIPRHGYNLWPSGIATTTELGYYGKFKYANIMERYLSATGVRLVAADFQTYGSPRLYRHWMMFGKDWELDSDISRCNPLSHTDLTAEDWYLKVGGAIEAENVNTYYCNPTTEYAEAWLTAALDRMDGEGWCGVCLDYVIPALLPYVNTSPDVPDGYATSAEYYAAWQAAFAYIVAGFQDAGYQVVGNCCGEYYKWHRIEHAEEYEGEYDTSYTPYHYMYPLVDGTCFEQGAFKGDGDYQTNWMIESYVFFNIKNDPKLCWVGQGGLKDTTTDYASKKRLALAIYLAAVPNDTSIRAFNTAYDWEPNWTTADYDFEIGVPVGEATMIRSRTWLREFKYGYVIANYDNSTYAATLAKNYVDADGTAYTAGAYTVPARTGLILREG